MSRQNTPRKYPRMARVNEVVREALGDELERLSDPRLGIVTITGVDVSADLRQATVYYSALGRVGKKRRAVITELQPEQREELAAALNSAAPHLRAALGRQVRMKYTPELVFRADPSIAAGKRIDEIIRDLHRDDPEYDPLVADELARQGLEGAGFERAGNERADGDGEDSE
jgi:ribosome-binding factor A